MRVVRRCVVSSRIRPLFGPRAESIYQPPRWLDPPDPDGPEWDEDLEDALRAVCVRPADGGYGCGLCGPCREVLAREAALVDEARDAAACVRGEAA